MKNLLLGLALLLSGPAAAQTTLKPPPGNLRWSASRPLTAADFRGRAPVGTPHAALTSANINTGANCRDNLATGTAQASFDPATSWVRDKGPMSPALLRHEQLHFDLAEVYARRLRQQLAALRIDCAHMSPVFQRLSQSYYTAWQQAEDAYDRDTRHGLDAQRQAAWETQVQQQLSELAAWVESES